MTLTTTPRSRGRHHGFGHIEVLLSVVLLGVLLVPALQALQSGIRNVATPSMAAQPALLRAKMEEVLSRPFPELYAVTYLPGGNTASVNATYSDAVGATGRRVVVLYRSGVPTGGPSAGDTGLLYVSVYYFADGTANALTTLAGRWW